MTAAIVAAALKLAAYLAPFIIQGLQSYLDVRKGKNHDKNIQDFRKHLADPRDRSVRLADQHDRVLAAVRRGRRG